MGIMELFGKKEMPKSGVFSLQCELHPMSLRPNDNDYVDLEINVANSSQVDEMTSVVISVGEGLGVDRSAISRQREIRLGYLKPGEKKFVKAQIWGTQRTQKGTYPVDVYVISHFHDYAHVLNQVRKRIEFRVG
jgi:uncharacterized membrane protein